MNIIFDKAYKAISIRMLYFTNIDLIINYYLVINKEEVCSNLYIHTYI